MRAIGGVKRVRFTFFESGPEHGRGMFMLVNHGPEKFHRRHAAQSFKTKLSDHCFMQDQQFGTHRLRGSRRRRFKGISRGMQEGEYVIHRINRGVPWASGLRPLAEVAASERDSGFHYHVVGHGLGAANVPGKLGDERLLRVRTGIARDTNHAVVRGHLGLERTG